MGTSRPPNKALELLCFIGIPRLNAAECGIRKDVSELVRMFGISAGQSPRPQAHQGRRHFVLEVARTVQHQ